MSNVDKPVEMSSVQDKLEQTISNTEVLTRLRKSRGGYAAQLTQKYNQLLDLIDSNSHIHVIRDKFDDLVDAFKTLEIVQQEYVEVVHDLEPEILEDCEAYFESKRSILAEARQRLEKAEQQFAVCAHREDMIQRDDDIAPMDSASQQGTCISNTSSARAKAAAKKAALQAKVLSLKKQQELKYAQLEKELSAKEKVFKLEFDMERAKQESDMNIQRVELEGELAAASAEATVLSHFLEDPDCKENLNFLEVSNENVSRQPKRESSVTCRRNEDVKPDLAQLEAVHLTSTLNPHAKEYVKADSTDRLESYQMQRQMLDVLSLPKTTLMTYDGDPLTYWLFINSFDSCVGNCMVDDGAKLNRLFEYCTGKAAKVIRHCIFLPPSEGYLKARQLLKERFGDEYKIAEAWIQKVTKESTIKPSNREALQDLADDVRACVEVLRAMNKIQDIDSRSRMLKIISRLPLYLQSRWRKKAVDFFERNATYPNIDVLAQFLERVAREANDPVFGIVDHQQDNKPKSKPKSLSLKVDVGKEQPTQNRSTNKATSSFKQFEIKCYLCKGSHCLRDCPQFKAKPVQDRLKLVKEMHLCFNCLQTRRHSARNCTSQDKCGVNGCSYKHSHLLHQDSTTNQSSIPAAEVEDEKPSKSATNDAVVACGHSRNGSKKIALPIVSVWVKGVGQEHFIKTNALLDSGSNRTFCSLDLVKKLKIDGQQTTLSLETLDSKKDSDALEVTLEVTSTIGKRRTRSLVELPRVYAIEKFPSMKGSKVNKDDMKNWKHMSDIEMPEAGNEVALLIGQDVPKALLPLEVRHGGENEPYATRTTLGWTLNGPLHDDVFEDQGTCSYVDGDEADSNLDVQVERFWSVDSLECSSSSSPNLSIEDKEALQIWDKSLKITDGHYTMDIPFREGVILPDNKEMAERRMSSLAKRFLRDPILQENYSAEMTNLVQKGYAELVPEEDVAGTPGRNWYIPHHNVINPKKPEKFRIVFDCAAQYKGTSLNKNVLKGPDFTNRLLGVLLRFRENKIAIMADVESMFHQVRVSTQDRDALRYLWWKDGDISEPTQIYRMNSHLFGGIWSPSSASYALRRTATDNSDKYSEEAVNAVLQSFYVDDFLESLEDVNSAQRMQTEVSDLLMHGGFHLTKWMSNSRQVLNSIPEMERSKQLRNLNLDLGTSIPQERALGVHWNPEDDVLGLCINVKQTNSTRRGLLSTMSSVYDPIGLVGPYVLQAKHIFQDECRLQKDWDAPLEPPNEQRLRRWLDRLPLLKDLTISRCLVPEEFANAKKEIHIFCDASQDGYGAVAYLRLVDDNNIHCAFLLGKTRLAPIKPLTVPRLELLAAVAGIEMDIALRKELRLETDKTTFWSDSMIVLQYIKSRTLRFKTFVANRIAVIHEHSDPAQWKYVSTKENPADHASRGLEAEEAVKWRSWLQGPDFLWEKKETWRAQPLMTSENMKEDKEVKQEVISHATTGEEQCVDSLLEKYSSWMKLKRAAAWLRRFIEWIRSKRSSVKVKQLTPDEMKTSETAILTYVQKKYYMKEIQSLKVGKDVSKGSDIYSLEPFIGNDGLVRVKGRLQVAPITEEARHPIILPRDHHVTMLIVRYVHECQSLHSGQEHMLALIRQKYWIPKCRPLLKKMIRMCVTCQKVRGQPLGQRMANLPEERLTSDKPPFAFTGVDCFGPFMTKRGRSQEKRYGCVFTCMNMRAIHIEMLHSLEADSFLNAFLRFTSRRGFPEKLVSDNGTNFVCSEKVIQTELTKWNDHPKVRNTLLTHHVEWDFNPPSASHMGGIWERQIRTIRKVMNSVIGSQVLDDERLNTIFCEVESTVNGRPLTKVSDDLKDPEALTPNHLLMLRNGPPPLVVDPHKKDAFGRRWRHVQLLSEMFWRRWKKEYISQLNFRQKWMKSQRNLGEGEVVLISDEMTPRRMWPLGCVVKPHVGADGLVRSVELKTKSGILVRPVHKLILLEGASG